MGDGVVHRADAAVALDPEVAHYFQHGIGVILPVGMGFQEVEKQIVRAVVGDGVADGAVGYFDLADALDQAHIGAVAGEIEKVAGAVQPP